METSSSSAFEYNTRIREMPATDRPRERLRNVGAENLTRAELLAIILRTGSSKQSALGLAQSLLKRHGGLAGLARLSFSDLLREDGIGEAKAAEIKATFRLAALVRDLEPQERTFVRSPADVMELIGHEMALLEQEHLRVILLNTRNQVLGISETYKGNVSQAVVRVAELFREPIRQNAPCVILVHNHPSGDPSPSPDDINFTSKALEASKLLQIEVLDHIIIGDRQVFSMKAAGKGFDA